MARRSKEPKIEVKVGKKCDHCDQVVLKDAPLSGIIAQIGPKLMVICCDCGTQLVHMQQFMIQRWG